MYGAYLHLLATRIVFNTQMPTTSCGHIISFSCGGNNILLYTLAATSFSNLILHVGLNTWEQISFLCSPQVMQVVLGWLKIHMQMNIQSSYIDYSLKLGYSEEIVHLSSSFKKFSHLELVGSACYNSSGLVTDAVIRVRSTNLAQVINRAQVQLGPANIQSLVFIKKLTLKFNKNK